MSAGGVYAIVNKVNGKQYVGRTVNFGKRWTAHRNALRRGVHHSAPLQRAFAKYAETAFEFRVLWEDDGSASAQDVEQHFLSNLDCVEYNASDSASAPPSQLGKPKSEDHKRKMSEALSGEKHPNFGKTPSTETRQKQSEAMKDKPKSEEHKQKLSAALKGKTPSAETLAKMSGEKNHMFGKKHSAETKQKQSAAKKGKTLSPEVHAKAWATRRRNAELRRASAATASAPA